MAKKKTKKVHGSRSTVDGADEKLDAKTAEERAEENLNGWKRALADYENLKRESEASRTEFAKYATQGLIEDLLPTLDYFDAAMAQKPTITDEASQKAFENWAVGIAHVQKLMMDLLDARGLKAIEPSGMFDPTKHEAAEERESKEPEGTIIEALARGYELHGKLIRPARVIVSK